MRRRPSASEPETKVRGTFENASSAIAKMIGMTPARFRVPLFWLTSRSSSRGSTTGWAKYYSGKIASMRWPRSARKGCG